LCGFFSFLIGLFGLLVLTSLVFNPTEQFGIAEGHHHSNIQSKYDLTMGQIDHWCLEGGDANCLCEDPLIPMSRTEHRSWVLAFNKNKGMIQPYIQDRLLATELDVAFLGGSIVEEIQGRWMGSSQDADLQSLSRLFRANFQGTNSKIQGVALGIAGDSSPNVLYRIMHGEMPEEFNPRVWWIHLGMNDLGRMKCSEEVTVIGILRVVEEILDRKPDARIVINSLFPMASLREGDYPVKSDYKDTFDRPKRVPRNVVPAKDDTAEGEKRLRRALSSEDEEEKLVEKEEERRDKLAKKTRGMRKREKVNPRLVDKTKIRKFRPGFLGKRRLPLWTSIRQINKELSDFAANNDRVYFVDSTSHFASNTDKKGNGKTFKLRSDRISARGHPTEDGYRAWETQIKERLEKIIDNMKVEAPHLFLTDDGPDEAIDFNDDQWDADDNINVILSDDQAFAFGGGWDDADRYGDKESKNEKDTKPLPIPSHVDDDQTGAGQDDNYSDPSTPASPDDSGKPLDGNDSKSQGSTEVNPIRDSDASVVGDDDDDGKSESADGEDATKTAEGSNADGNGENESTKGNDKLKNVIKETDKDQTELANTRKTNSDRGSDG
jgi:lysophospholipase L1-like esterase